jgi:hypothetical protein
VPVPFVDARKSRAALARGIASGAKLIERYRAIVAAYRYAAQRLRGVLFPKDDDQQ